MFYGPYTLVVDGKETVFKSIVDAAQHWANASDGVVLDSNRNPIPSDCLWAVIE